MRTSAESSILLPEQQQPAAEATATVRQWRRFGGMVDGYGICDADGQVIIPQDAFNGLNQYGDEILRRVNNFDALREALAECEKFIRFAAVRGDDEAIRLSEAANAALKASE